MTRLASKARPDPERLAELLEEFVAAPLAATA
jgi:hypothetical protein